MTEEQNGLKNGSQDLVGGNGNDVKASDDKTANSSVDELANLKAKLSKQDALISKFAEEKKAQADVAEQARLATLSTEEKLKELEATIQADKQEKALINAATSNGLNLSQAKKSADLLQSGDYEGWASLQSEMLNDSGQKATDDFKSKFETSNAPKINNEKLSSTESELRAKGLI